MTGKTERSFPDDLLIVKRYTANTGKSPAKGAGSDWTVAQMGYSNPTGYVPIGASYISVAHQYLGLSYFNTSASATNGFGVRNGTNTDITSSVKPVIDIVYASADFVEVGTDITGKPFKVLDFEKAYTLASSSTAKFSATDLGLYVPAGYQIFSLTRASSGHGAVGLISFDPFNNDCVIQVRNAGSSSRSPTAVIGVSFIRKDYAEKILA